MIPLNRTGKAERSRLGSEWHCQWLVMVQSEMPVPEEVSGYILEISESNVRRYVPN